MALAVVLGLLLFGCAHEGTDSRSGEGAEFGHAGDGFVVGLSDLHFDPFYDPTIVPDLLSSGAGKWRKIFEGSKVTGYGEYGRDSNFPLLLSALRHAGKKGRRADFVVISGDFLGHGFNENYYKYAGNKDPKGLQEFIDKTMEFMAGLIVDHFPDIPIFPALGNEDAYCGDYRVEPNGPFLKKTAGIWRKLLRDRRNQEAFGNTFPIGGYYSVHSPREWEHRLIILNTVFMSSNYQNACGKPQDIPAADELRWLADQLQDAAAKREKVWLIYHIPPGIDTYGSAHASDGRVVTFWQQAYTQPYLDVLDKYRDTVVLTLAGHSHMDDVRLLSLGSRLPAYLLVTPAISPIFGNNPGFHMFAYHPRSFALQDYATWMFNLPAASGEATWKEEYRFSQAYGVSPVNGATLELVWHKLEDPSGRSRTTYIRNYNVSDTAAPPITDKTWPVYWCAIGYPTETAFRACLKPVDR